MISLLEGFHAEEYERWAPLVELGLHHEQQHQELLLTDVKYNFACNPLRPAYTHSAVSHTMLQLWLLYGGQAFPKAFTGLAMMDKGSPSIMSLPGIEALSKRSS